jgi:DUF2946 family protein
MTLSLTTRRVAALAAAFGIALQALWPLVAQARPRDAISVPICSVDGTSHSIELAPGDQETEKRYEHCKLCVLGADKPLVSGFAGGLLQLSPEGRQEKFVDAARPHFNSSSASLARPRAPPAVS